MKGKGGTVNSGRLKWLPPKIVPSGLRRLVPMMHAVINTTLAAFQ
jgi:hypothetical protein